MRDGQGALRADVGTLLTMSRTVQTLAMMPPLLILACLLAGGYGAVHDQLTYVISPEYFTKLKFVQFEIPPAMQNRLGVAVVGWGGTWWFGALAGFLLMLPGLAMGSPKLYFMTTLRAYGIVGVIVAGFGLGAAVLSKYTVDPESVPLQCYYYGATDLVSFARVGMIHTSGYIGGVLGAVIAMAFVIRRTRGNRSHQIVESSDM